MYVGIDIGGTKTLATVLTNDGEIVEQTKFATPKNYDKWVLELRHALAHFKHKDFQAGGLGMPGPGLDKKHGIGISFGNLPWKNVPVQRDVERIAHCPFVIENDARMAALSEAMLIRKQFKRILYVTVSTGVGYGFVNDGVLDGNIGDGGGRTILLEHKGKLMPWEDFAGGRAIVARYGKLATDIHDAKTWTAISRDLAKGLIELIAITQPEVIVFGGSVGTYFERYGAILSKEIAKYHVPIIKMPELRGAQRPEEAVIYGCYDLAKQTYGHAHAA